MKIRSFRPLTEDRRHRVTRWFVGAQFAVIATTLLVWLGIAIHEDMHLADPSAGLIVGLLVVFTTSSWLVLTFGWIGVYMAPTTAWPVIGGATVVALMSGFLFYGLSIVTTPVLLLVGVSVRGLIVGIQRWMGIRLVPTATALPTAAS